VKVNLNAFYHDVYVRYSVLNLFCEPFDDLTVPGTYLVVHQVPLTTLYVVKFTDNVSLIDSRAISSILVRWSWAIYISLYLRLHI